MATYGKTEKELWSAIRDLDDDLLDPDLPEGAVDTKLLAIGVDPKALAGRGREFVAKAKEEARLAWQVRARERQAHFQGLASRSTSASVPALMGRDEVLARLEELRRSDEHVGPAITMAARKRKPEESSDEELRALLDEMEALRAIEEGSKR